LPSPVIRFAFMAAPVVALYSPTVPVKKLVTKRVSPDSANPLAPAIPVRRLGLIAVPVTASYSPTLSAPELRPTYKMGPACARMPAAIAANVNLWIIVIVV
jgi:hypothetical protein